MQLPCDNEQRENTELLRRRQVTATVEKASAATDLTFATLPGYVLALADLSDIVLVGAALATNSTGDASGARTIGRTLLDKVLVAVSAVTPPTRVAIPTVAAPVPVGATTAQPCARVGNWLCTHTK